MQHCAFCGSELPPNARFCGHCGRTPGSASGGPTSIRDAPTGGLPPLAAPTAPSAPPNIVARSDEEQEQRRRAISLDGPLPIFPGASGQPSTGSVPMVQALSQVGGAPMVPGTPAPSGAPNASGLSSSGAHRPRRPRCLHRLLR